MGGFSTKRFTTGKRREVTPPGKRPRLRRPCAALLYLFSISTFGQTAGRPSTLGWYSDITTPEKLSTYAAAGATTVLMNGAVWWLNNPSVIQAYMDQAQQNGVKIIFDIRCPLPRNITQERFVYAVNRWKTHPALSGWYLADEPDGNVYIHTILASKPGYYHILKQNDPDHPVMIAHNWRMLLYFPSAVSMFMDVEDVLGLDLYPAYTDHPDELSSPDMWAAYAVWQAGLKMATSSGKQFVQIAQGFGKNNYELNPRGESVYRDTTSSEMRWIVYSGVVQGVRDTLFWGDMWNGRDPGNYADPYMVSLSNQVIEQLNEIGTEMSSGITNDPAIIVNEPPTNLAYRYGINGSTRVILAVNIAERDRGGAALCDVRFTLPQELSIMQVIVLNENRTIAVVNGEFSDSFKRFEVHAYKLIGAGQSAQPGPN